MAAMVACLSVLAWLPARAADDITVRASVDRTTVSQSGQLVLTIEAEGTMRQVGTPKLPPLGDFNIYSAGSSTNMSWVNGQMTSSRSWTYRLLPKSVGEFTIGPAEIEFGGAVYSTEPIEVTVVEGEAPSAPQQREERTASGVESGGRNVFITTSVSKNRAYVGEQVTMVLKLYQAVELWDRPEYSEPDLTGFWREDIPDREEYYEVVDGVRYHVTEYKTALFATSSGKATIGPARLVYRESASPITFFSRPGPQKTSETEPIEMDILPLPAEGKPASFRGAVGDYTFTASLDTDVVDQWKPATLKIRVRGTGNIRSVPDPELPDLPEFRVYESGTSTDSDTSGGLVSGTKTYEYVLVPQTAGPKSIPSMELSFFDPKQKKYRTVATPELSLGVTPAEEGEAGPDLPARAAIARLGRDIRYIHEPDDIVAAGAPMYRRPSFVILQFVPLVALAGAVLVRRRRDRFAGEEGLERYVKAPALARRELKAARDALAANDAAGVCSSVSRAVVDFISARLKVGARGMTLPELEELLMGAGAADATIEKVKKLLGDCDLGRFAGGSASVESGRLISEAEECLKQLERLSAKRRRR